MNKIKAFTIIEMLVAIAIMGILLLVVPNLNLFVKNAVKKEGVLLARTIIEQERIFKADNGKYETDGVKIQNWKPVKTLLIENKYFRPETKDSSGIKINLNSTNNEILTIKSVSEPTSCNKNKSNSKCCLEVEVKASEYSSAKGWHIKAHLIEGTNVENKKGKAVANKIIFEEAKGSESGTVENDQWEEIAL